MTFTFPATLQNDPARKGQLAAPKQTFGENKRYAVAPVYTRFDAIEWFVWDADRQDDCGNPDVIRQQPTLAEAVAGLVTIKFEIGNSYSCRSICDWDCVFTFEVTKRTEKTVTLKSGITINTRRIRLVNNVEQVDPLGRYSMSPVLSADRKA